MYLSKKRLDALEKIDSTTWSLVDYPFDAFMPDQPDTVGRLELEALDITPIRGEGEDYGFRVNDVKKVSRLLEQAGHTALRVG